MNSEKSIINKIMMAFSSAGHRIFRNNTGMAWTGIRIGPFKDQKTVTVFPGDVLIRKARPFHGGLCKGSSDLIGFKSITITEEMVGKKVAIFSAIEVKTKNVKTTDEQKNFVDMVNALGGYAVICKDADEVDL